MNLIELQNIMVKHGVTIRAIPREMISIYEVKHIDKFPDGFVYYDEQFKRDMLKVIRVPENAGCFVIEKNCGVSSSIQFKKSKYYDSIEDAVKDLK